MSSDRMCEGRVCIVTGAGRGLGREYALSLARHGAKVVVNDLGGSRDGVGTDAGPAQEVVDDITAAGGEGVANTDDISSWDGAAQLVQQAIDTFGKLDVLVNNAGILRDRMLFTMTEEEWDSVIRVHLKGTFAPSHHAAAYWRERSKAGETNDARLVNTTSVSGLYANVGQTNYGAAKSGIATFTQIAAQELSRYGVTVERDRAGRAHASDQRPRPARRDPSELRARVGGAGDHLARVAGLGRRHRPGHRGVRPRARDRGRVAPRPVDRAGRDARGGRAARAQAARRRPTPHALRGGQLEMGLK